MKPLTKGEKRYIVDSVDRAFKSIYTETDFENLKKQFEDLKLNIVLSNSEIKSILNNLKKLDTIDLDRCNVDFYINDKFLVFKIRAKNTYFETKIILNNANFEKISKIYEKINIYSDHRSLYRLNIDFEFYYMLFSTWKAPATERLNKANELIKMIVDKYTVSI